MRLENTNLVQLVYFYEPYIVYRGCKSKQCTLHIGFFGAVDLKLNDKERQTVTWKSVIENKNTQSSRN